MAFRFRAHQTIKTTPAVKAGIAKHTMNVEEMVVELLPILSYQYPTRAA